MSWTQLLQNHDPFLVEDHINFHQYNSENRYCEGVIIKQIICTPDAQTEIAISESNANTEKAINEGYLAFNNPHPNLCKCLGWGLEAGSDHCIVYIAYAPMPRSVHEDMVERAKTQSFYTEAELCSICDQTLSALSFLEELEIAYRDIKPQSIFLSPQGQVKVGYISFAKEGQGNAPEGMTLGGAFPYYSPLMREYMLGGGTLRHDVFKSGVYSFGMVLMHLSLLEMPQDFSQLPGLQARLDKTIDSLTNYSAEWRNLLKKLLQVKEENRPRFLTVQAGFQDRPPFSDDDPLVHQASRADIPEPLTLSVVCGRPVRVSTQLIDEEVPCMITIKAPSGAPPWRYRCCLCSGPKRQYAGRVDSAASASSSVRPGRAAGRTRPSECSGVQRHSRAEVSTHPLYRGREVAVESTHCRAGSAGPHQPLCRLSTGLGSPPTVQILQPVL